MSINTPLYDWNSIQRKLRADLLEIKEETLRYTKQIRSRIHRTFILPKQVIRLRQIILEFLENAPLTSQTDIAPTLLATDITSENLLWQPTIKFWKRPSIYKSTSTTYGNWLVAVLYGCNIFEPTIKLRTFLQKRSRNTLWRIFPYRQHDMLTRKF